DARVHGPARCVRRLSDRRSVREDATERHVVAVGRRPSTDREHAAHVGVDGALLRCDRVKTAAVVLAVVAFWSGGHEGTALCVLRRSHVSSTDPPTVRVGFLGADGRYTVTAMPLDTYVARVVAGEALRDSRPAALEALAIAVRTFAAANRSRHRADGF